MATTPPSPVSSWTLDAKAGGSGGGHPAPALVWPGSTKSLTVQDASCICDGTLNLKLAQENEALQVWLEDAETKRQFYATWTNEECKAIVKDFLEPNSLLEILHEALSATGEAGQDLSASFEWGTSLVTLILHVQYKWIAKAFRFPLAERHVGQVDRLERRMEDMMEKQAEHAAKIQTCMDDFRADQARRDEEAERAELSCWSLHVSNPHQSGEGFNGHFAMSGNHFLIQDVDYTTKKTGVSTHSTQAGFIQATFPKPVHVRAVKIAAFPRIVAGISGNVNNLTLSVQSPETGEFETLRQDILYTTKEEVFPVDKTILALRLSGIYLSISKLIFS